MKGMKESVITALLVILAGVAAIEMGISTAILEIIAGVFGANFLGLSEIPWLEFLANFGLLGIMFFAGFEANGKLLKKYWARSVSIGAVSYLTPFVIVLLVCLFILNFSVESSLLIAIGMSTTSLALVYPVLKEKGALAKGSGQIFLTSAMVVDIASMLSLSLIFGGFNIYTIVFILAIGLSLWILPKFGKWLFSRYECGVTQFKVRFIFLVLLSLAFFSEKAGVHAAVLAFVAGFIFSELLEEHQILEEKLRGVIFGFLAPLFFLKAGMAIDLKAIDTIVLVYIGLFSLVAFFSKYFGTLCAVNYFKIGSAKFAGFLFNFRLSFGIIVAIFGFQAGLISSKIYIALIAVILFTSIISSFFLKIFPHEV